MTHDKWQSYGPEYARRQYMNSTVFHAVVDFLESTIYQHGLTPGELRDAVQLACMRVEERMFTRPVFVPYDPDTAARLRKLQIEMAAMSKPLTPEEAARVRQEFGIPEEESKKTKEE